jgi:tetratricopeptide (TPR) repeat protein
MTQGRVAEAMRWAEETLDVAKTANDADLLIAGHALACSCCFWMGELVKALNHTDQLLGLYDDEKHHHLADIFNHDPKTLATGFASICTWMLGYRDRALLQSDEKDAHARRRGHPFDLGFALHTGAHDFADRWKLDDLLKRAREIELLGRENSLPVLWILLAPATSGQALIRGGKPAEGIAPLKASITAFEAIGGHVRIPTMKTFLAEGTALTGDLDNALHLIDEITAQVERPGWEERLFYAETLRLKGWILSLKSDLEAAERNFLASLDCARHQQAKSLELRTSTSLARLWQSQGKRQDAYELLAPVYNWFTEGFDTKDLQDAKVLLDELA